MFAFADIVVGGAAATSGGAVRVYSVHLENLCGAVARMQQMAEVLRHAASARQHRGPTLICGDLNTLQHGALRCVPLTFDALTWASIGLAEQDVWRIYVTANSKATNSETNEATNNEAINNESTGNNNGISNSATTAVKNALEAALGVDDAAAVRQLDAFHDADFRATSTTSP